MHSHAERWLVAKKVDSEDPNLLALNGVHGGKFLLSSDEDWRNLHKNIVRDSLEGNRNFLVESKTPVFKLFFDIDFAHATLGLPYILEVLLPAILTGVEAAVDSKHAVVYQDIIVASSPSKPKKELTKTGVHLHWQQMALKDQLSNEHRVQPAVNPDTAMAIRASVLECLAALPDEGLNFSEVVDEAVLKKNGIRMLFSSKSSPCQDCSAAKRKASKEHPCEQQPKAVSFWKCTCPGCMQARRQCKVSSAGVMPCPPKIALHLTLVPNDAACVL